MQLVRKANATRSIVAAILDILLFDIYQRMNASVRFDNQKDLERIEFRWSIFHRQPELRLDRSRFGAVGFWT